MHSYHPLQGRKVIGQIRTPIPIPFFPLRYISLYSPSFGPNSSVTPDKSKTLLLYKPLIRPHVEYAVQVWSTIQQRDVLELKSSETLNKRVGGPQLWEKITFIHLFINSLIQSHFRGNMIIMYKYIRYIKLYNIMFTFGSQKKTHNHSLRLDERKEGLISKWERGALVLEQWKCGTILLRKWHLTGSIDKVKKN